MSSISSISGASAAMNPYLTELASVIQSNFGQTIKDFQAVGTALQSGNMTSAQTAMASLQKNLPAGMQSAASQPFGKNTQANTDFQALVSALKASNLGAAQKAFASLQTDIKGASSSAPTGAQFSTMLNSLLSGLNPGA